jgi:hypothetical protein
MRVYNGTSWTFIGSGASAGVESFNTRTGAITLTSSDVTTALTYTPLSSSAIGTTVQAYDAQLADVAGLTPTDNNFIVGNGTNFVAESGSTARTSLGLGSIATQDASNVTITGGSVSGITDLAIADGGTGASDTATARTNLGLAIGTNVQAYDAQLADVAGLTPTDNGVIIGNGTNFVVESNATLRTSIGLAIGTDVPSPTGTGASGTWAISVTGNAATATNGVVTTGSYADPAWITSLAGSKVSGNITGNAANVTGTVAVANGGTGTSTPSLVAGAGVTITGSFPNQTIAAGAPTTNTYDTGTAATWTKPSTASWVLIETWGGGGSGGKGGASAPSGGGGGGAYNSLLVRFADLQGTVTYTVGAGGAAQTTNATSGNAGGTSSVTMGTYAGGGDKTLSAFGGIGGQYLTTGGYGGGGGGIFSAGSTYVGGSPFGGGSVTDVAIVESNYGGGTGGVYTSAPVGVPNNGSNSVYGGGGGGSGIDGAGVANTNRGGSSLYGGGGGGGAANSVAGGNAGTSIYGGNGSAGAIDANTSSAGTTPAGGSGGTEGGNSGAGGGGRVRFTYW